MAMTREARNAILIENKSGRVSQVPISGAETIYQGDLVFLSAHLATKMTTAADASDFLGVSDHTNPQYSAGVLTSDYTKAYINVVQSGLVGMIAGAVETLQGFQSLKMITDAQHVRSTAVAAETVGCVDPGWAGAAGKLVAIGDLVKMWLKVPARLQVWGPRVVAEAIET